MTDPKICIISLIGKSQLMPNQSKAWKLNSILQKYIFNTENTKNHLKNLIKKSKKRASVSINDENDVISNKLNEQIDDETGNDNDEAEYDDNVNIESYFDSDNNVLYLNLESIFDTNNIIDIILNDDNKNSSFFKLWEHEQTKYVKAVLLLFSLSHIIIVSHPTVEFDIGYIRFFRIVDVLRNKLLPSIIELIKTLNLQISKEWVYAGRPCSPRVLFTFENCPKDILNDFETKLTKLEGLLEDQIYNSLRKSYVITNISNNSLFAIPANNTFVYIHRLNKDANYVNNYLLSNLHKECLKTSKLIKSNTPTSTTSSSSSSTTLSTNTRPRFSYQASRQQQQQQQNTSQQPNNTFDAYGHDSQLFSNFIYQHITIAFREGFNDNIGRTNIAPIFELPKLSNWLKIYETLYEAFFNTKSLITTCLPNPTTASTSTLPINEQKLLNLKTKLSQSITQIKPFSDIDVKFSMNRCKKSLPGALSVYQEGLPQHYTRNQHNLRLEKARHNYSLSARGPMYKKYLKQLENDCLNIWKQGRQLCEAISLTGNPCTNEMHRTEADNSEYSGENTNLPLKGHNSNIITIATSNCGFYQKERIDPFNLKDANYTFYQSFSKTDNEDSITRASTANKLSNKKIVYFDFPIFKPTAETTSLIMSSLVATKNVNEENEKLFKISNESNTENLSVNNLSQDDDDDGDDENNNNNDSNPGDVDDSQMNNNDSLSDLFANKLVVTTAGATNATTVNADKETKQQNSPSACVGDLFTTAENTAIPNAAVTMTNTINVNKNVLGANNNDLYQLDSQLSSKTVYLEGMTHSDSQPGLLPLFSSWSLCSIGKYSDYSVHSGLTQPGFLNGHNYLLPWDIYLKNESKLDKKKSKYLSNSLNKKTGKDLTNKDSRDGSFIRCYIGMEYECPCGHRFICSAPDRLVKLNSNGTVKDDANKLVNGDMPLYTACPCRNSKDLPPFMAQLMRIFIAVPPLASLNQQNDSSSSSSVHVLLQPKVQPNPSPCPIFRPSYEGSIKLTDNSIWVLRLPYIYMGDDQTYYRPKDFETLNNCRVLKGMFTWIEK